MRPHYRLRVAHHVGGILVWRMERVDTRTHTKWLPSPRWAIYVASEWL